MILDTIANLERYACVHESFKLAAQFLKSRDASRLEPGKYEIDGSRLYAIVQEYETKPQEQCVWEAHRRYCDIQCIIAGEEQIGYTPISQAEVSVEYKEEIDCSLFQAEGDYFRLRAGSFAFFAPQDVHMPGVAAGEPSKVKKIVFKAAVDW